MTALAKYARLESAARYFDGSSGRPLDVMVSFGERSLVIMGFDGVAAAHWPLATLKSVSERGDTALALAPDIDSDERLVIRDVEMIRAIETVCQGLRRRPRDLRGTRSALIYGLGAVAAVLALVFVILPGLAGQLAPLIPPEREKQLGDALVRQIGEFLTYGGEGEATPFCREPSGIAALERMSDRLDGIVDLPVPLRVSVIDHTMVNAFAAPGGRVVLLRGLIEDAVSPEEVAGVLAHEMGHVLHRDPTVGVLRSAGTAGIFGLMVGDVFGAAVVVAGSEALLNASYQRDVEARADATAFEILRGAGLPASPLGGFFSRLAERYGTSHGLLDYLKSHPNLDARAEAAASGDTVGEGAFEPVLSDADWLALRQICSTRSADLRN